MASPAASRRDDRVLAPTRWVSIVIVPVLVTAFVLLYVFPSRTEQLWSWTINPDMTAVFMGAGYLAGSYFFVRAATVRRWHEVGAGFVAITLFATLLFVATVMHWERFNHDHVSFWAWLGLYTATPPLLPWLWWTNRRTDPGPEPESVLVPPALRRVVGVGGLATLAFALVMFVAPGVVTDVWPWPVTELTARSLSPFMVVPAVAWAWFLVEPRWSALRILQHVTTIGFVLILAGSMIYRESFRSGRLVPYLGGLAVALLLTAALQVHMEMSARSAST